MPRVDPHDARVFEVVHNGVGAIVDKGPWKKGNHMLRDHYTEEELPHIHRLIDKGAIRAITGDDLEDLEAQLAEAGTSLDEIPRCPWEEFGGNPLNVYTKFMSDREAVQRQQEAAIKAQAKVQAARPHREVASN